MNISVFSTYANDRVIDKTGRVSENIGGPLFFLKKALEDIDVDFKIIHGETVNVEIKIVTNGEVGRVVNFPKVVPLPANNTSNFIIISTVFNEWDLRTVSKLKGKIFLDIQGYVREGKKFGAKVVWKKIEQYADSIYCLKGTKEEVSYLPKNVYENQKKRLLIITDGEEGVEWFSRGQRLFTMVERNVKSMHTIGVGDTFFGYFVGFLSEGQTLDKSMKLAISKTEKFLSLTV